MSKSIVVYYTWAGHTKKMAETISTLTGAQLHEVMAETPYSGDYSAVVEQAKREIRENFRPAIEDPDFDLSCYDVIYVGTPIWWGTMAPPLATFLSGHDLSGKTLMPFSTHGGGGKGHSDGDIARLCPGARVMDMYTAYEGGGAKAEKEMADWIKKALG